MTIEYSIKFENGGVTIRQTVGGNSVLGSGQGFIPEGGVRGSGPEIMQDAGGEGALIGGGQGEIPDGGGQGEIPDGGGQGEVPDGGIIAVILGPLVIGGSQCQPNANGDQIKQLNSVPKASKAHHEKPLNPVAKTAKS